MKKRAIRIQALLLIVACAALVSTQLLAQQLKQRPRYKLLPGDQIAVHFPLTPEFDQQLTIEPDGYVVLTAGGEAQLAGLTLDEATDLIKQHATVRLNSPEVHLALLDFQHPYFVVAGEVANPNRYDLRENITALQAVMIAGGIRISGKQTQVILVHDAASGQPTVRTLSMKHIDSKMLAENPLVMPGDIIYVPRNKVTNLQQWTTLIAPMAGWVGPAATIAAVTH